MSFANSAFSRAGFVFETVFGTTPSNPAFQLVPHNSLNLGGTKGTIEDDTISPDRHVLDQRSGNMQTAGDLVGNLVYGAYDNLFAAVFCADWASDELLPAKVRRSLSIMRHFTDLSGGASPYHIFRGVTADSVSFELKQEAYVKCTFGLKGRDVAMSSSAPAGATFPDAPEIKAFDTYAGSALLDGVTVANITEASFKIVNGADPRFFLFDDKTGMHKIQKYRVDGSLTLHFETSDLITAFFGGVEKSLAITITDPQGNDYLFEMPRIKLNGGQPDTSGENDIMLTIPFFALYDVDEEFAFKLTRTAA